MNVVLYSGVSKLKNVLLRLKKRDIEVIRADLILQHLMTIYSFI